MNKVSLEYYKDNAYKSIEKLEMYIKEMDIDPMLKDILDLATETAYTAVHEYTHYENSYNSYCKIVSYINQIET